MAAWARVKEVVASYLEARTAERAELRARVRAEEPSVAREVESIVASWDSQSNFLEELPAAEREGPALLAGSHVGSYEVLGVLGKGGMGEVYRARDTRLGREVALKVLPARLTDVPSARSRFEREARAVAALSHPNILALHDFNAGPPAYAVSELLVGRTLRNVLVSGPLSWDLALRYAREIAAGLAEAHGKGVVHRDLKPANVFVRDDGHVKILDFGLAKQLWGAGNRADTEAATMAGMIMGTVGYMSPEQVRGEAVGPASDVFSFGAVLYECVTGLPAFQGSSSGETLAAVLRDEPSQLRNVPPAVRTVLRRCLQKRPEQRFSSGVELREALEAAVLAKSDRRSLIHGAGAVLILGAALFAHGSASIPPAPDPAAVGGSPLLFLRNSADGAEYARIPAGRFTMGCVGEADCPPDSVATIEFARPYWLMRTEVTAGQYLAFTQATRREVPVAPLFNPEWKLRDHPVNNVTWFDARDYCTWAGGRLPSEAEWERSARATHEWRFEWGTQPPPMIEGRAAGNLRDEAFLRKNGDPIQDAIRDYDDGFPETAPVGNFPANDVGVFDLTGNVAEWVADKGLDTPGRVSWPRDGLRWVPRDGRAWEGGNELRRVLRGSGWDSGLGPSHLSYRLVFSPYGKASVTGFRCARDRAP
jgi:formylglycine-generating enzyme required for sulfatase activity